MMEIINREITFTGEEIKQLLTAHITERLLKEGETITEIHGMQDRAVSVKTAQILMDDMELSE